MFTKLIGYYPYRNYLFYFPFTCNNTRNVYTKTPLILWPLYFAYINYCAMDFRRFAHSHEKHLLPSPCPSVRHSVDMHYAAPSGREI